MSQLVFDKLSVIIGTIACLLLMNLNKRKKYERLAISMIWIITWDQYCRLSLAWISEKTGFLMIEIIAMIAFMMINLVKFSIILFNNRQSFSTKNFRNFGWTWENYFKNCARQSLSLSKSGFAAKKYLCHFFCLWKYLIWVELYKKNKAEMGRARVFTRILPQGLCRCLGRVMFVYTIR